MFQYQAVLTGHVTLDNVHMAYIKKLPRLAVQRDVLDGRSDSRQPQETESRWLSGARDGAGWANQIFHNFGYLTKGSNPVKA
jgi:hypothetical protein